MNVSKPDYRVALEALLAGGRRGALASTRKTFGAADDDFWFWLNTEGCRHSEHLRSLLPGLPPDDLQFNTIGSSGDAALREAFDVYRLIARLFREHGATLVESTRVLDFGCGWGRILRFLLREVDQANLWGLDPGRFLIDACRRTNPWCQFVEGRKLPPSPFASEYFDLVYSYSVFSHLSEAAHRDWIDELRRILRPGGVLVATTWQREHILRSEQLRAAKAPPASAWHRDLAGLWLPNDYWLQQYDAGRFCYQPYPAETHPWSYHLGASCYGEACVPEPFVRSEWAAAFDVLQFIDDRSQCAQNVIVGRRR